MESLNVETVLDLLRTSGATIESDAADAAKDKFGELVLVDPGEMPGEGDTTIREGSLRELKSDLMKWKKAARAHEGRIRELEEALESGESTVVKERDRFKNENEKLRPIVEEFKDETRKQWEAIKDKIPEKLQPFYKFPAEGEDLGDEAIIANVKKLAEHLAIGAIGASEEGGGEGKPTEFRKPAGGRTGQRGSEDVMDLPREARMEAGYRTVARRDGDEGSTEKD